MSDTRGVQAARERRRDRRQGVVMHFKRQTPAAIRYGHGRAAAICRPRARYLYQLTTDPEQVTCERCRRELERRAEHKQAQAAPVEE